jgi:SAM-dependent methyltransferase
VGAAIVIRTDSGYDSLWWSLIYDQWNETGGRSAQRQRELDFYRRQLPTTRGAILEAACGTGSIMLPLLVDGFDVVGCDSSLPMLEVLRGKAADLGISDIGSRTTQQNFVDFAYDYRFTAVMIPASAIMMLSTQTSQITCLRRVYDCLQPGGRLLLNFYVPSYTQDLLIHRESPPREEEFGDFIHPETGNEIEVSYSKVCDLASQTESYTWIFRHDGTTSTVPMHARWIYPEEFQLLLRLCGFGHWELYGDQDCGPYVGSEKATNTYWVVTK